MAGVGGERHSARVRVVGVVVAPAVAVYAQSIVTVARAATGDSHSEGKKAQ